MPVTNPARSTLFDMRLSVSEEDHENAILEAVAEFYDEYPKSAIALLSGSLVGLLEFEAEEHGGDKNKPIRLIGFDREIIILAAQHNDTV